MAHAQKRAKTTAMSTVLVTPNTSSASLIAQPQLFIPFQTGTTLERIPDDVLREILSHLPALSDRHVLFGYLMEPPVIPSTELVRTPTLRALSQTSRLLRSRCLAMAWRSLEFCGASLPKHNTTFYRAIGEATKTGIRVLKACPHLLPFVQTASVVWTRYQIDEIVPAFAACLATLPNLTTIQIIRTHCEMTTPIKNGFEGRRFPSVRRIFLSCTAHEIVKSCPNVEEVVCTKGNGSTIVRSLVRGKCHRVRILKGISAPLARLVKTLPNLKYVTVAMNSDLTPLAGFPLLDTIEIAVRCETKRERDMPLCELAASDIKKASQILKENRLQGVKTVIVMKWNNVPEYCPFGFGVNEAYTAKEVIRV